MDVLTVLNSIILGIVVVLGLLKLADSGDGSGACCVSALLALGAAGLLAAGAVWGLGELVGWW